MLRRFFVVVALVALLSPGALVALSPGMDSDDAPTAETTSGPEDDTELSPAMDPDGLEAPPADTGWPSWLHDVLGSLFGWVL